MKRARSAASRWTREPLVWTLGLVLGLSAVSYVHRARQLQRDYGDGRFRPLDQTEAASRSFARDDDYVLRSPKGTAIVVSRGANESDRRPLRGALVDLRADLTAPSPELLLWWMPGYVDWWGRFHSLRADAVRLFDCGATGLGLRSTATNGTITLRTDYCLEPDGEFAITTTAEGLPQGFRLADELANGTAEAAVDGRGIDFERSVPSSFLAVEHHGSTALFQMQDTRIERKMVRVADESFPAPVHVVHPEGSRVVRTLRLQHGDLLDALAHNEGSTRQVKVTTHGLAGSANIEILAADGTLLVSGALDREERELRLPPGLGKQLRLRDHDGNLQGTTRALDPAADSRTELHFASTTHGTITFRLRGDQGRPAPAHVLFKGLGDTPDPVLFRTKDRYGAGRSVYLPFGRGDIPLPGGNYLVTASSGPTRSLVRRAIAVLPGKSIAFEGEVVTVIDTSDWVGADFHLHAAPSGDSKVTLEERLVSLWCEGLDFAVATDHNRITDYAPYRDRLGFHGLATLRGIEITTHGNRAWGHFNAFPMALPHGPQERAIPPYMDTTPTVLMASARELGAKIVQVNHGRMQPKIGYFDFAGLDPETGLAGPEFADDFDAIEAMNGIYIQDRGRIRQGVRDLVALARRGKRVAATGNSDSHRLLYDEAGWPRTWVHTPREPLEGREERVVEALRAGHTTVSSGPFVTLTVNGAQPGDVVRPSEDGTVMVHIRVDAPEWVPVERIELWLDDEVYFRADAEATRDGMRYEADLEIPIDRDRVILAWAEANTPLPDVLPYAHPLAVGFTGLVYIDFDGDGKVHVAPHTEPPPEPARQAEEPAR